MNEKIIVPIPVGHIKKIEEISDKLGIKPIELIIYWLTLGIKEFEASNKKTIGD